MNDATQAKPLLLPDPGKFFMLAMRHGPVELACCIDPSHIDDDAVLAQHVKALRNAVKTILLNPEHPCYGLDLKES